MAVNRQPIEVCYINESGAYVRVFCTEIDRAGRTVGTYTSMKELHDEGNVVFMDGTGYVIAQCPPNCISWVRVNPKSVRKAKI
jgi:hypothetical protein